MNITKTQLGNALIMAARYAHTRKTGAALQIVTTIKSCWNDLRPDQRRRLAEEASTEATCNFDDWNELIKLWNDDND